jgi:hypothetical protein
MWKMLIKYILLQKVFLYIFPLEFYIELQLVWHLKFNNMSLESALAKSDFSQVKQYKMWWQTKIEHFLRKDYF